jgi:hypothetical protein
VNSAEKSQALATAATGEGAGKQETLRKHSGRCAERLAAVDGTPFGDFPAEKAS